MPWNYTCQLPNGMFKIDFHLDDNVVVYKNKQMPVDQISGVSVGITKHSTNGIPTNTSYAVLLSSPQDKLRCTWSVGSIAKGSSKETAEEAYSMLHGMLQERVGPRIAWGLAQMSPVFGPWTFSPQGISTKILFRERQIGWHQVRGTTRRLGFAYIRYDDEGTERDFGAIDLDATNAIFLEQILQAYWRRCTGN